MSVYDALLIPHISVMSYLSNVLFTGLSYGATLDSLGAVNRQIPAKEMHTYIHICIVHIYFYLFEFRSFRSVRTVAGPGGVIGHLPKPK